MARRLQDASHQMRARERFEHTEPWGFSPEGSGVRTRPDLEREIGPLRETIRLAETAVAPTDGVRALPPAEGPPSTAFLAPQSTRSEPLPTRRLTRPSAVVIPAPPPPLSSAYGLTIGPAGPPSVPLYTPGPASIASYTPGPLSVPSSTPAPLPSPISVSDPPVPAAVYASVHAMLLAASQVSRAAVTPPAAPAPAAAPVGFTPAQRIYVLATAVALSVMATALVFLTLGAGDARDAQASRTPRLPASGVASLATSAAGSATRKDAATVAPVEGSEVRTSARRPAPGSSSAGRVSSGGTAPAPGTPSGAAKLDEAARSAKMLRDQLNSAVN